MANPARAAAIRESLKLLDRAYRWTAAHPSQWGAAWSEASGLPAPIMVQAAKMSAATPVRIADDTIKSEQGAVDQFYAAGLFPTRIDIHDYMTDQFNDTVGSSS